MKICDKRYIYKNLKINFWESAEKLEKILRLNVLEIRPWLHNSYLEFIMHFHIISCQTYKLYVQHISGEFQWQFNLPNFCITEWIEISIDCKLQEHMQIDFLKITTQKTDKRQLQSKWDNRRYQTSPAHAIPQTQPPARPIGRIACAHKFSEYYLRLPGILPGDWMIPVVANATAMLQRRL